MANNLEYGSILQENLDLQLVQQSTTGWMEENAGQIKYEGGAEVKIPKITMTGLGDYNREKGEYPKGKISLQYQSKTLGQDRGAEFYFDRHDVDETNYLLQATMVLSEFQRKEVIPEIDSYRYSKMAKYIEDAGFAVNETLDSTNILKKFLEEVSIVQDRIGVLSNQLIVAMSYPVYKLLILSDDVLKMTNVVDFEQGDNTFQINNIAGVNVIPVQSNRMKTKYNFFNGESEFGYEIASDAKDINYIIAPKTSPIAVSKTDEIKIFSPEQNQDGDGWKTQYRKYHDLWILDNSLEGYSISIKE